LIYFQIWNKTTAICHGFPVTGEVSWQVLQNKNNNILQLFRPLQETYNHLSLAEQILVSTPSWDSWLVCCTMHNQFHIGSRSHSWMMIVKLIFLLW